MDTFNLIPYYRDLLVKTTQSCSTTVNECVLKSLLHKLGLYLQFDGIRLFLVQENCGELKPFQIYGDKAYWKDVNIAKMKREKTKYKDLYFLKIRHMRENGQFMVLGYFSFHSQHDVSSLLINSLDVFCLLYGNYIIKRIITSREGQARRYLSDVFKVVSSSSLPGTKIIGILDSFRHLIGFNKGVYCTMCNGDVYPEYVAVNTGTKIVGKSRCWTLPSLLVNSFRDLHRKEFVFQLSELPQSVSDYMVYRDLRDIESFRIFIYPIFVDDEIIGMWMFLFSSSNPYNSFDFVSLLNDIYEYNSNSYKFLFQRRFRKMIINPIFHNRNTRLNEQNVFVIMPFTEEWSDEIWGQIIKPAVQEINMNPVRADDLYGQNIMEDVWKGILQSAIVICDTTGRNPNVFYELGIAHTLGKKVLLLTQDVDDIPFDLRALRHIQYVNSVSGGNILKENIKKSIKELVKGN